jgi:hypothetical protein
MTRRDTPPALVAPNALGRPAVIVARPTGRTFIWPGRSSIRSFVGYGITASSSGPQIPPHVTRTSPRTTTAPPRTAATCRAATRATARFGDQLGDRGETGDGVADLGRRQSGDHFTDRAVRDERFLVLRGERNGLAVGGGEPEPLAGPERLQFRAAGWHFGHRCISARARNLLAGRLRRSTLLEGLPRRRVGQSTAAVPE